MFLPKDRWSIILIFCISKFGFHIGTFAICKSSQSKLWDTSAISAYIKLISLKKKYLSLKHLKLHIVNKDSEKPLRMSAHLHFVSEEACKWILWCLQSTPTCTTGKPRNKWAGFSSEQDLTDNHKKGLGPPLPIALK